MAGVWLWALGSVLVVSLLSLIGVITLPFKAKKLEGFLTFAISFSAGALFGDAFLHLLPEVVQKSGFGVQISLYIICGIAAGLVMEKIIHWRHCHMPITKGHIHRFAWMNLWGDAVHNFIDGIIIASSYIISAPVGIATTLAVIFHEIPQEIADFGVLVHGGFSKARALFLNFITALASVIGAVVALLASASLPNLTLFLVPFSAGTFIYIAGSDLIPEMHHEEKLSKSLGQFLVFALGVGFMALLKFLG
ncbi:MAG: ZIP family metal transporter [Nanoarchaeota archaeon]|nr:ZIP family metal transporter [Nanoarchaeota archaeon]